MTSNSSDLPQNSSATDSVTDEPVSNNVQLEQDVSTEQAVEQTAAADVIGQFFKDSRAEIPADFRCGFVAIVGRPNVGKSTLMNHLIGQKLSITSRKPQTTRHKIIGIDTRQNVQAVYVDTPGMHKKEVRAINKMMNRAASSALRDVNLVLFVVDSMKWVPDDVMVLEKLQHAEMPVIMVINKVDTIEEKRQLLPLIESHGKRMNFSDIVPVSALRGANLEHLHEVIAKYLPFAPPMYAVDQLTDRSERFLASEIVREKIMRQLGEELPYDLAVQIESFKEEPATINEKTGKPKPACLYIDATILVERQGQKAIVIGDKGRKLKQIGMEARVDMEKMFEQKIMLTLWVKVKGGWSDDERALKSLGYSDI